MFRKIKGLAAALALVGLGQAAPASAQYMPHLDPNLYIMIGLMSGAGADPCLAGTAMSEAKIAEARTPAPRVMQAYFTAAQGGGSKSAAFHLDKHTRWQGGGVSAGMLELDRQADPLAAPGNRLEAEPLRFYRGGTGATALGQWAVVDGAGDIAGVYTALFTRSNKLWKLRELSVARAGETVAPVAQYCRKPGDVMEHRLSANRTWRDGAQKSVDEARTKLAAAQAKAGAASAALAAAGKRRDPRLELNARDAARSVASWTRQLEQRTKNLTEASEKLAETERDEAEIKRLTGEARGARAFRLAAAGAAATAAK